MFRSLMCALFVLVLCAVAGLAREYKGNLTKIDRERNTLTLKTGAQEKTFVFLDKTIFIVGKEISKEQLSKLAEKLGDEGRPATIATEEKDNQEVLQDGKPVAAKVTIVGKKK